MVLAPVVRGSSVPAYEQVENALLSAIRFGTFGPGARLPSEHELLQSFGVSRVTVRRALTELYDRGLILRSRGRGWYVPETAMDETLNDFVSFSELGRATGVTVGSQLLELKQRSASEQEAERLRVEPGSPVMDIKRIRTVRDEPTAIAQSILPLAIAPVLSDIDYGRADLSLYEVLRNVGLAPAHAKIIVSAKPASAVSARLLGIRQGAPLLTVEQVTRDQRDRVVELGFVEYIPEHHRFAIGMRAHRGS